MFLACLTAGQAPKVEFHLGNRAERHFFEEECQEWLPAIIPKGITVRLVRWAYEDLHNRYILTDCGGVAFLEGLDDAMKSRSRVEDVVVALDQDVSNTLLGQYDTSAKPPKYKYIDECRVVGTKH